MQKLSKFGKHCKVLLWCRNMKVCDLEITVWRWYCVLVDPCTIHHLKSQASCKFEHLMATLPPATPLTAERRERLSAVRWSRCASTSCCALMASGQSAAACLHQAESWAKKNRQQQTSQLDPKHVHQPSCQSQSREYMTLRVKKPSVVFSCLLAISLKLWLSYVSAQSWA